MSSEAVAATLTQAARVSIAEGYSEFARGTNIPIQGSILSSKFVGLLFTMAPFAQWPGRIFPVAPPQLDSLTFTVWLRSTSNVGPFTVSGALAVDTDLDFFSSSLTPADVTNRALDVTPSSSVTLVANAWQSVTMTAGAADRTALKAVMEAAGWIGTVGLRVTASGLGASPEVVVGHSTGRFPTLNATKLVDAWSGRSGAGDVRMVDRMRECPRCGGVELEKSMVEDGYRRGMLVCQDCWEPPEAKFRPLRGISRGHY